MFNRRQQKIKCFFFIIGLYIFLLYALNILFIIHFIYVRLYYNKYVVCSCMCVCVCVCVCVFVCVYYSPWLLVNPDKTTHQWGVRGKGKLWVFRGKDRTGGGGAPRGLGRGGL